MHLIFFLPLNLILDFLVTFRIPLVTGIVAEGVREAELDTESELDGLPEEMEPDAIIDVDGEAEGSAAAEEMVADRDSDRPLLLGTAESDEVSEVVGEMLVLTDCSAVLEAISETE
jgi:hypothetical protein